MADDGPHVRQHAPVAAVAVILVRPEGWLLAQHRDSLAPISPNQWGLVGGVQEEGEDALTAALRELREETALIPDSPLRLFYRGSRPASSGPGQTFWHVYCAPTNFSDDDIVVGEGRDICFVEPAVLLNADLGVSARFFLPLFLDSPDYRACCSR